MARRPSTQRLTRRRTLAAVAAALVVATGVVTASSASPASSSQADHLRAIETTRLQALVDADTATARKLIAPDFQLINPAGAPLSRDDLLGGVDAGVIDFLVLEPSSPIAVRLSGDSATLRYQTAFDVVLGGDPCHPRGMDHRALRASGRTLADRLGADHRHPEQPRPVHRVDRAGQLTRRPRAREPCRRPER